jgi:hypothetical protein
MELLRKLVMVAVAGLIGWGGQATGWAGAMLPRYRIEDMGLVPQYSSSGGGSRLWLLSDGGIWSDRVALDSNEKLYRKGDYLLNFAYSYSIPGKVREYILKKDGSDINLLRDFSSDQASLIGFSSSGQALFDERQTNGEHVQFVYEPLTGERSYVNHKPFVGAIFYPYAINGLGQVVGEANIDGIGTNATFYMTKYSEALLLSSLVEKLGGWSLIRATDINDAGEIIGYGNDLNKPDSDYRVFKLVPIPTVPEPSSCLILAIGTILVLRKYWRHDPLVRL